MIHIGLANCLDMMCMRKLKYLAIAVTLVEVIVVAGLVYDVLVVRESALAYSCLPVQDVTSADNSDSSSYGPSPQATFSIDDSYLAERWGVSKIEAPQAWQITRGDQSIGVSGAGSTDLKS